MVSTAQIDKSVKEMALPDPVFNGDLSVKGIDHARRFVDEAIAEAFASSAVWKELASDSPEIYNSIRDFVLSDGKRLRPILFYLFYRAFTPEIDFVKAKKTMAAMEMIHSFILIHDDIIDKSDFRRSQRTLNKAFASILAAAKNSSPVKGEDMALVAGDMLYAFAVDIFNQAGFEPSLMSNVMQKLSQTALMTAHGEFREILGTTKDINTLDENSILRIYDLKTSYYTFFGPVVIASMVASSETEDEVIEDFTLSLGKAFQIHNDIKEIIESNPIEKIPKDFIEKKRTLPLLWAYQASGIEEKKIINDFLKSENISLNDFYSVRNIYIEKKIIEKAQNEIRMLTNRAVSIIMNLNADKNYLQFISNYIKQLLK